MSGAGHCLRGSSAFPALPLRMEGFFFPEKEILADEKTTSLPCASKRDAVRLVSVSLPSHGSSFFPQCGQY